MSSERSGGKIILYGLIVAAFLDTFVQLPIMSPFASELGAGPLMIGVIVGLYSLTNMIGNVGAGRWIDRIGAKKVLQTGMAATAAVLLLYLLVRTPWQLAAVRALHGLAGGLLVPSVFTLVSGRARSGRQGKSLAVSGAAVGIAAVIGPALGGIMKKAVGLEYVFVLMSALLAVGALAVWRLLADRSGGALNRSAESEAAAALSPEGRQAKAREGTGVWLELFRNRHAVAAFGAAFSLMFTMGVVTYMLPLKADRLLLGDEAAGMMLSAFGLVAILLFVLPTNRMYDALPAAGLMTAGMTVIAVAVFGLSLVEERASMTAVMAGYGVGFALLFPSMNKLLVEHVPESSRGRAFGLFYAFYSIGVVAGSVVIGALAAPADEAFRLAGIFMAVMAVPAWLAAGLRRR